MPTSYLVRLQGSKEIGRFHAPDLETLRRGEAVVVLSIRGMEKGEVVTPCLSAHESFFPAESSGKLLRPFTQEDETTATRLSRESGELLFLAQRLAEELQLRVLVLDADILLDESHAVIRVARMPTESIKDWVVSLSSRMKLQIYIEEASEQVEISCGSGNCGSQGGGCGTGGCGTGGCGSCPSK